MNQARTQIPTKSAGRSDTRFFFHDRERTKEQRYLTVNTSGGDKPRCKNVSYKLHHGKGNRASLTYSHPKNYTVVEWTTLKICDDIHA